MNDLDAQAALVIYYIWRSRLVPPQPRTVHKSRAFEQNPLTVQRASELAPIIADIEQGRDSAKYLSRAILRALTKVHGDERPYLDMLLNAWGVHHFHISSIVEADGFVKRDDPLLLVSFTGGRTFMPRALIMATGTTMQIRAYVQALFHQIQGVEKALTENPHGCAAIFEP